jgi:hypothetical protein
MGNIVFLAFFEVSLDGGLSSFFREFQMVDNTKSISNNLYPFSQVFSLLLQEPLYEFDTLQILLTIFSQFLKPPKFHIRHQTQHQSFPGLLDRTLIADRR